VSKAPVFCPLRATACDGHPMALTHIHSKHTAAWMAAQILPAHARHLGRLPPTDFVFFNLRRICEEFDIFDIYFSDICNL
jgi:hypothetical protein